MWNDLSRAALETAKQQLDNRHEETLRRHAEELNALESKRAELVKLDELIAAFLKEFVEEKEPSAGDLGAVNAAPGISLFVTQAQKSELRKLGIAEERIRSMKPQDVHQLLGIAS